MHPRFMKLLAVAFAGGSAVLLACAVHDDTNFPNPPQPTSTTSPTRTVVFDSGVVTLLGEAGGDLRASGPGGQFTPDAAEAPDAAPEITLPDAGGLGSSCDLFAAPPPAIRETDATLNPADWHCEPQASGAQTFRESQYCRLPARAMRVWPAVDLRRPSSAQHVAQTCAIWATGTAVNASAARAARLEGINHRRLLPGLTADQRWVTARSRPGRAPG